MAQVKSKKKAPAKKVIAKKAVSKKPAKPIKKTSVAIKAVAKKSVAKPARPKKVAGFSEQLRDAALKVLDERQADEIHTVDLTDKSSMADYLIIASGRASRQLSAIAHYLTEAFEKLGIKHPRIEGLSDANWVLVDAGDVIVHLFRPEVRSYYDLEGMWRHKNSQ